ncbi:hypothetical protein [Arthrobacter glacialis]|uniref:Uncharacterized protein n=1 Tax=Arthrobacter glacialis TaxID=1664 RepID=A0A2S3ZUJ7_ARTGL|nr:hypothetical protein [Arthrobacter glacialis]POH72527.1 hypothetical protein CVS27_15515 [Arthrobacter glacialis]
MTTLTKLFLVVQAHILGFRTSMESKLNQLRVRAEVGDGAAGWVLILIGVIAICALVIIAVTAFVNSKLAQLK